MQSFTSSSWLRQIWRTVSWEFEWKEKKIFFCLSSSLLTILSKSANKVQLLDRELCHIQLCQPSTGTCKFLLTNKIRVFVQFGFITLYDHHSHPKIGLFFDFGGYKNKGTSFVSFTQVLPSRFVSSFQPSQNPIKYQFVSLKLKELFTTFSFQTTFDPKQSKGDK